MSSKITVEYDIGECIITDNSTWFIPKVGDVIILNLKCYILKSIDNHYHINPSFW